MKFCGYVRFIVLFLCLFGFAAISWSTVSEPASQDAQGVVGIEAVITKIDNGQVTLQSTSDVSKEITISMNDVEKLKVGDKVRVEGNNVSMPEEMHTTTDPPSQDPKP